MIGIEIDLINILYFDHTTSSAFYNFFSCNFLPVLIISMASVCLWLSACVAIERVLIESGVLQMFSSRQHSFIVSIFVFIIVNISHIYRIFNRHTAIHPLLKSLELCEFTPSLSIQILDNVVEMLHLLGPCLVHLLCTLWVLFRIIKHKIDLQYDTQTTTSNHRWSTWKQQIHNHRDFFIPPLLIIICILPHVIIFYILRKCPNTLIRMRLNVILNFLVHIPEIFTFFIYIYPSKLYWEQFLQTKIGKLLRCYCCFAKQKTANRKVNI